MTVADFLELLLKVSWVRVADLPDAENFTNPEYSLGFSPSALVAVGRHGWCAVLAGGVLHVNPHDESGFRLALAPAGALVPADASSAGWFATARA